MAAGKCDKCGYEWSRFQNGGHDCPIDNVVKIPAHLWEEVEKTANECKKAWGMGFPIISLTLLKQILKREEADKPKRDIHKE